MRSHRLNVRFRDLDALGHVNSGVYIAYMETARVAFASELFSNEPWYRVPLILASARCEYKRAIEQPVALEVKHCVSRVGASSWDLDYAIEDEGGNVYAIGRTTQVWYDYDEGESGPIPAEAREALEAELGEPLELRASGGGG